jgi:hypothetical protein
VKASLLGLVVAVGLLAPPASASAVCASCRFTAVIGPGTQGRVREGDFPDVWQPPMASGHAATARCRDSFSGRGSLATGGSGAPVCGR